MAPTQRTKFAAVAALAVGSVAAAAGTANAAQGGLATENAGGSPAPTKVSQTKTPSSLTKSTPSSGGQGGVTTETKKAPTGSPAPATTSATVQKSAPSGGGQGGIATEAPAPTIAQAEAEQEQPKPAAPAAQSTPSAASAPSTSTQSAPARAQTAAYTETYTDTSKVTATPATPATTTAQVTPVAYTETTTATGQTDNAPSTGQGGLVTEAPAEDSALVEGKQPADTAPADYTERVETASQTPTSGSFTPASPAEPNGAVSTYTETRQGETAAVTGGEVGVVGPDVATGTAVEVNDTTSYVSNTTVGGGEQATAAQTWDVSNGNYNATWATTGGVSGTGGFSATNEQTAPNVGTTTVDGQWASADGASSVSVSGGATLENYGVHGAQGSVEITTPIGDFAFVF